MKKRLLARIILCTSMVFSVIGFVPSALATHTPVHVVHVSGISKFPGTCEYIKDNSVPPDDLGIPKPAFGSDKKPQCEKNPDGSVKGCHIARNTNPIGLYPPCAGNISAEDSFGLGCIDPMGAPIQCGLNAPTWFYGYCGQTYGGADGGVFTIGGVNYLINRMGFARGRGVWEFSGKMTGPNGTHSFRMHLAAAPDQPTQLAGCDLTNNIESIVFAGTLEIYRGINAPVKTFRTRPGWHWCDADQPFHPGSAGEDC